MSRYIDADALVTDISFFDGDKYHYGYSQGMINSAPTVDLENPKAYIAVDFKGDYVLFQANYVYSDGTRLSSEIAKVRIPLENGEHGMSLGNNVVISEERKDDEQIH